MRRASAITLLAAIGLWLVAPVALLAAEANLPACCRRSGTHHCAMGSDGPEPASGSSFSAVRKVCASFPAAISAPACPDAWAATPAPVVFGTLFSHPSSPFQTEARYRMAFSRGRQKRGPPSLLR